MPRTQPRHTHHRQGTKQRHSRQRTGRHTGAVEAPHTPKQFTAVAAAKYHVPFWLLWGIAGAESTWGAGGTNLFGLLDAAEGVDVSNWQAASMQSAKTLAGLRKQWGSWGAAVQHYSGNSYTIAHPKELAASKGVTPRNSNTQAETILTDIKTPFGTVPFPGPTLDFTNPLGPLNPINPTELGIPDIQNPLGAGSGGSLISWPGEILEAAQSVTGLFTLLQKPEFWIRAGEAIGGAILVYMALKNLTGTGATDLPGGRVASEAAKAAAFKALPPKQRVKVKN